MIDWARGAKWLFRFFHWSISLYFVLSVTFVV